MEYTDDARKREMAEYKVKVIALQETRWKGNGKIHEEFMYYGGESTQVRNSTVFMIIDKQCRRVITGFKPVNDGRILCIRLPNKHANVTIINVMHQLRMRLTKRSSAFTINWKPFVWKYSSMTR